MWKYYEQKHPEVELVCDLDTAQELGRANHLTWSVCKGELTAVEHKDVETARKFYGGLLDDLTEEVDVQGLNIIEI